MNIKPSAIDSLDSILKKMEDKEPLFFLDYDGTLTPIVSHPKDALLSDAMRKTLENLASRFFTAVISGRGLKDIKELVGLQGLYFAGSHGFQLENPKGEVFTYPEALPYRDDIEQAYRFLNQELKAIPGIFLENKEFSIAVHYRQVAEGQDYIKKMVEKAAAQSKGLKITYGKKVYELRPNIEWHKGKAVLWLIENASSHEKQPFPIVIGDDATDEDAFMAVHGIGTSIFVQGENHIKTAEYTLKDPGEVQEFLQLFLQKYGYLHQSK